MKVLFVTASYPTPEEPLLGVFVKEHARAAAEYADVAVVHLDRAAVRSLHVQEAEGEEFPTWRIRYPRAPAALSYAGNVAAGLAGYLRARSRGFAPDVIHAHFFLAAAPVVALAKLLRTPVVVTEQWSVFLPEDPLTLSPLPRRVARFAFSHADVVMPVSAALADGIRELGGDPELRIVPNVVDTTLFHPGEPATRNGSPRRLVGVGALYEAKGWDDLLDALAIVAGRRGDVHLSVIGDGPLRARLEAQSAERGLGRAVTFEGWRTKPEVADRMRDADLFVLGSRYDSNPCAVIEALATGVPVVGTAVGGIPEMVGDGMGLLAPAGEPYELAARIEEALDRPAWDRAEIAATAAGRYGRAAVGKAFAEVYAEVVSRRR